MGSPIPDGKSQLKYEVLRPGRRLLLQARGSSARRRHFRPDKRPPSASRRTSPDGKSQLRRGIQVQTGRSPPPRLKTHSRQAQPRRQVSSSSKRSFRSDGKPHPRRPTGRLNSSMRPSDQTGCSSAMRETLPPGEHTFALTEGLPAQTGGPSPDGKPQFRQKAPVQTEGSSAQTGSPDARALVRDL